METNSVVRLTRRNNRGVEQHSVVLAESCQKALGDARANNTNPFWPVVRAEPATLKDFWRALEQHDWYYEMSDDTRVRRAGQQREQELIQMAGILGEDAHRLLASWAKAKAPGSTTPLPEQPS